MDSTLNPYRFRIQSVDVLRGIVMLIMALDHVRFYMGATPFNPVDPEQTSVALFFTRWITHFCAPVFIFLAGTSAFLYARNTNCDLKTLRNFLLTRGLLIIFVEIVVFNLVAQFLTLQFIILQVLWVIGWSMIILAGLIYLPRSIILIFGLVLIFGHNLLDIWFPDETGWFFSFLHNQQVFTTSPLPIFIHYPLLPWPGVMAIGYAFGRMLIRPTPNRNAQIWFIGLIAVILFFGLRALNIYGDPSPWESQPRGLIFTLLSFLNTTKYPPSLLFLLMTLGPAVLLMPWLEKWQGKKVEIIGIFGKVPFFFYLLHFFVIHLIATGWSIWQFGTTEWWLGSPSAYPEEYEFSLSLIYGVWIGVVILCYPLCRWYANYKKSHREQRWLSYL